MKAADEGVYCGPLRLLAMEIYDECNAEGTYCNLITGAKWIMQPSCTVTSSASPL